MTLEELLVHEWITKSSNLSLIRKRSKANGTHQFKVFSDTQPDSTKSVDEIRRMNNTLHH
jgi:hypothetical protein